MSVRVVGVAIALFAAAFAPGRAQATDPDTRLSPASPSASWVGDQFSAANPVGCVSATDPTCDHHYLVVDSAAGSLVDVSLTPSRPGEELRFSVYAPNGREVAASWGDRYAPVAKFVHTRQGALTYELRVQPVMALPGDTYRGSATLTPRSNGAQFDGGPEDCLLGEQPPPTSVRGITDVGQTITLNLRVLLDGVTAGRAAELLDYASVSYAPTGVEFAWTSESVSFAGTDAAGLIAQAKAHVGGVRPPGTDVVVVMTNKNITSLGQGQISGLADCQGGVRYSHRAFMVAETSYPLENLRVPDRDQGPLTLYYRAMAKVVAHELGHLMGGEHAAANCAEGIPSELLPPVTEPSTCTLMFNAIDVASFNFSTVNAAIVRGYAVRYA